MKETLTHFLKPVMTTTFAVPQKCVMKRLADWSKRSADWSMSSVKETLTYLLMPAMKAKFAGW